MNSLSVYFDPEIGMHYRFGILGATVFGGYRFDAKGHLRYNSQETNLTTDWSMRTFFPPNQSKSEKTPTIANISKLYPLGYVSW